MYNAIAHIALFGWVPVALLLFARLRPPVAVTLCFLLPLLALPATLEVDWPLIPPIDRHVLAGVGALLGYLLFVRPKDRARTRTRWPLLLIGIQVVAAFLTVLANGDPIFLGPFVLPGLRLHDSMGVAFLRLVTLGVPFYLGMKLIRTTADVATVLRIAAIFGLCYVPIILWENRMSPQLHTQLYGVFPHEFQQHVRAGGFRPVGFTHHGLELALFMATATVAAAGLAKARLLVLGRSARLAFFAVLAGLVLCRSLGALVFGIVFPLALFFLKPRAQVRLVSVLVALVLLYPITRSWDLFPTQLTYDAAATLSRDRADSLLFRFVNEDRLLEKANERPLLGWGVWGRNRVYNPRTGRDESVTDGYWILELGMFGLVGFLSFFLLLTLPAYRAAKASLSLPRGPQRTLILTLVFLVVLRTVDFLPNAFPAPLTLFLAGSLMGFTERARRAKAKTSGPGAKAQGDGGGPQSPSPAAQVPHQAPGGALGGRTRAV